MLQEKGKRKIILAAAAVTVTALLALVSWQLIAPFLHPAPIRTPPRYMIWIQEPTYAYEVIVPAVVFPNGSLTPYRDVLITGDGTLGTTSTPLGAAFVIRGNGSLSVEIEYDFPSLPQVRTSRYPEGLPDLSSWAEPDMDPTDWTLGNVTVYVGRLPSGDVLSASLILEYRDRAATHSGSVTAGNGQHDMLIYFMPRQG